MHYFNKWLHNRGRNVKRCEVIVIAVTLFVANDQIPCSSIFYTMHRSALYMGGTYYSLSVAYSAFLSLVLYLSPVPQNAVLPSPLPVTRLARDPAAQLVLDNDQQIVQAFLTNWTKNPQEKPQPADIKGVFRIDNPALKSRFDQYCATLPSPNVGWHYHGTAIKCNLLQSQTFCSDTTCGVCGISGVGFDKARIGTHVNWFQRFGRAFCLAPNSSKCHEYTLGFGRVRALLYCQVALGNPYDTPSDLENYQSPPPGYNSVYGRAGKHHGRKGSLNYDEVAIYGVSEAILPKYIVVYQKDGINGLLR